jgi:hypothetical protein
MPDAVEHEVGAPPRHITVQSSGHPPPYNVPAPELIDKIRVPSPPNHENPSDT